MVSEKTQSARDVKLIPHGLSNADWAHHPELMREMKAARKQ
jgi:hypothetical protein